MTTAAKKNPEANAGPLVARNSLFGEEPCHKCGAPQPHGITVVTRYDLVGTPIECYPACRVLHDTKAADDITII